MITNTTMNISFARRPCLRKRRDARSAHRRWREHRCVCNLSLTTSERREGVGKQDFSIYELKSLGCDEIRQRLYGASSGYPVRALGSRHRLHAQGSRGVQKPLRAGDPLHSVTRQAEPLNQRKHSPYIGRCWNPRIKACADPGPGSDQSALLEPTRQS